MTKAPLRTFDTTTALAEYAAVQAEARLREGIARRGHAVLGCPSGRSAKQTYAALAARLAKAPLDGARVHLIMMDEFVEQVDGQWRHCPPNAHFSCLRFGEREIRSALNRGLASPIPPSNLHAPDAREPERYDALIEELGGIDLFLLASGSSDGHVAFNPPGTPLDARTRRIALAEATRRDNMKTFPAFRSLDEVPRYGVSVGPRTIATQSASALMILTGAEKEPALKHVLAVDSYDPAWPATVVHACRNAEILSDHAAVEAVPPAR